ncbi:MAG: MarR family transcriptional regulator [Bacillota bacterium]|nr:MarR family transcriptional regulator [Bacillota bacterium]
MPAITRDLNVIARCGMQFRGEHMKKLSLTAAQAPFILHIVALPGQSQEELAGRLHLNPSNVARQLSQLENLGFITRCAKADDKRQLAVFPTNKAVQTAPLVREINALWHDYLTQEMAEEEKAALETLLEKVRKRAVIWDSGRKPG